MTKLEWRSTRIALNALCTLDKNPRTIKENKYKKLITSVDDLGLFKPLVVDYDQKTILGGNQRYRAMLESFPIETLVDCMVPNRELTSAEKEKVILMDNSHYGEWDFDILANEFDFEVIKELDLEIPLLSLPEHELEDEVEGIGNKEVDKKFMLEVQLPNEMELRDLYDDLTSKGYMVKEK